MAILAKGVDKNGNNVSLSDEEYSQYLAMVDKIAEMNPVENGAVFFASGVFYYFKTEEVKKLVCKMAEKEFPSGL